MGKTLVESVTGPSGGRPIAVGRGYVPTISSGNVRAPTALDSLQQVERIDEELEIQLALDGDSGQLRIVGGRSRVERTVESPGQSTSKGNDQRTGTTSQARSPHGPSLAGLGTYVDLIA